MSSFSLIFMYFTSLILLINLSIISSQNYFYIRGSNDTSYACNESTIFQPVVKTHIPFYSMAPNASECRTTNLASYYSSDFKCTCVTCNLAFNSGWHYFNENKYEDSGRRDITDLYIYGPCLLEGRLYLKIEAEYF